MALFCNELCNEVEKCTTPNLCCILQECRITFMMVACIKWPLAPVFNYNMCTGFNFMIVGLFNDKRATIVCNVQLQPAVMLVEYVHSMVAAWICNSALLSMWPVVWIVSCNK